MGFLFGGMNIPGFSHCTSIDQLQIGLSVILCGRTGVIEWNEEYRSDYYTGLHHYRASEPYKVVFDNGDIFYPGIAVENKEHFHIQNAPNQ